MTQEDQYDEPLWHVELAIVVSMVLQFILPERISRIPGWIFVALEAILLVALAAAFPRNFDQKSTPRRVLALGLTSLLTIANFVALSGLIECLIHNRAAGLDLLVAALNVFLTNVIAFGLWYWEIDGGGPGPRHRGEADKRDFCFPQHQLEDPCYNSWRPTFFDYLYLSVTNTTAFSPTDTLPLTHRAKALMLVQALISLATVALVAARAVNILS